MVRGTAARFAGVGVVNTLLDLGLFMALSGTLGITLANLVSTSAGMTSSFVVNGLFTFGAGRLTLRHAALFLATNGLTLWVVQPLVIHALVWGFATTQGQSGDWSLLASKMVAIGGCLVLNFVAYRFVVWPGTSTPTMPATPGTPGTPATPTAPQGELLSPVPQPRP